MNKTKTDIQCNMASRASWAKKRSPRTDAQWTLNFEIKGRTRQTALRRAGMVFKHWGLVMPKADPLTPHFGLDDFYRIGEIEYWIVNDRQNGYCGKFLFLFKNQRCPRHHHKTKDETFFIVRGRVRMTAGRKEFTMQPGHSFKMRPGVDHTFVALGGPALIMEVSLPSTPNDNFFTDKKIGNQGVI